MKQHYSRIKPGTFVRLHHELRYRKVIRIMGDEVQLADIYHPVHMSHIIKYTNRGTENAKRN